MNAHTAPLLGEPTPPPVTSPADLVNGFEAGALYGLGGNILSFLRVRKLITPAVEEDGRKPTYHRADCIARDAEITSGKIILTGSARVWRDWFDAKKRAGADATPEPQADDGFEAVEMDFPASAEIVAALRPLAALADLPGAQDKSYAFPLVLHRGAPVLTMNEAREARLMLRKLEGGRS